MTGDWKAKVRERITSCDLVMVICGENTDAAPGVNAEVSIAQEAKIPYFFLWGRSDETCKKPKLALTSDKIYNWTWDNLKGIVRRAR